MTCRMQRAFLNRVIALLGAILLVAAPSVAHSQANRIPRVAYVWLFDTGPSAPYEAPFRKGMEDMGWIDGKTVRIESYDAKGDPKRLDAIMQELVRSNVDVIVAMCTPEAKSAMKATSTIPIVITAGGDLVAAGIVKSYSRPGGNVTGLSTYETSLAAKRVELLKEAFPSVKRATILWNPVRPDNAPEVAVMQQAAKRLGMELRSVQVRTREELATALEMLSVDGTDALFNAGDRLLSLEAQLVGRRAAELRLPSMFSEPVFIQHGGIMYYGADLYLANRRVAGYVDRILRGAKAGDLPIELPTRFDLGVNRKAARQLGLKLPESLLIRADHVID